jgi:hypothetical protein
VDCSNQTYVEAAHRVPAPRLSGRGEVVAWTLHAS